MIYPGTPQFSDDMDRSDWASTLAVAVVAVVLVASGPLAGGLVQPSGTPTTVDDGNATVASVAVPAENLEITPGRFGTDVSYLRIPDAEVRLASVTDHPRLVYRIEVPALDVELTATKIVTDRGTHRLHLRDYGMDPATVTNGSYDATVSVRVQSFGLDRTVSRENVTVEVGR